MMISDCAVETATATVFRLRGGGKTGFAVWVEITLASSATTSGPSAAPLVAPHHIIAASAKIGKTKKNEHRPATVLMLGFETCEGHICLMAVDSKRPRAKVDLPPSPRQRHLHKISHTS